MANYDRIGKAVRVLQVVYKPELSAFQLSWQAPIYSNGILDDPIEYVFCYKLGDPTGPDPEQSIPALAYGFDAESVTTLQPWFMSTLVPVDVEGLYSFGVYPRYKYGGLTYNGHMTIVKLGTSTGTTINNFDKPRALTSDNTGNLYYTNVTNYTPEVPPLTSVDEAKIMKVILGQSLQPYSDVMSTSMAPVSMRYSYTNSTMYCAKPNSMYYRNGSYKLDTFGDLTDFSRPGTASENLGFTSNFGINIFNKVYYTNSFGLWESEPDSTQPNTQHHIRVDSVTPSTPAYTTHEKVYTITEWEDGTPFGENRYIVETTIHDLTDVSFFEEQKEIQLDEWWDNLVSKNYVGVIVNKGFDTVTFRHYHPLSQDDFTELENLPNSLPMYIDYFSNANKFISGCLGNVYGIHGGLSFTHTDSYYNKSKTLSQPLGNILVTNSYVYGFIKNLDGQLELLRVMPFNGSTEIVWTDTENKYNDLTVLGSTMDAYNNIFIAFDNKEQTYNGNDITIFNYSNVIVKIDGFNYSDSITYGSILPVDLAAEWAYQHGGSTPIYTPPAQNGVGTSSRFIAIQDMTVTQQNLYVLEYGNRWTAPVVEGGLPVNITYKAIRKVNLNNGQVTTLDIQANIPNYSSYAYGNSEVIGSFGYDLGIGDYIVRIPPHPGSLLDEVLQVEDPSGQTIGYITIKGGTRPGDVFTFRKNNDRLYFLINGRVVWTYLLNALQLLAFTSSSYSGFYTTGTRTTVANEDGIVRLPPYGDFNYTVETQIVQDGAGHHPLFARGINLTSNTLMVFNDDTVSFELRPSNDDIVRAIYVVEGGRDYKVQFDIKGPSPILPPEIFDIVAMSDYYYLLKEY